MNWDVLKSGFDTAIGWASFLLDKPAQLFANLIHWAPKTSLLIAVALLIWAMV